MIVICFLKDVVCGGYGDRILGIASGFLVSKLLNRKFKILWEKEDISNYLSSNYIVNIPKRPKKTKLFSSVSFKHVLMYGVVQD